jgi:hypothetical protein
LTYNDLGKWSPKDDFDISAQILVIYGFSPLHEDGYRANLNLRNLSDKVVHVFF